MQDNNDPRATIVANVSQDQQEVDKFLGQLKQLKHKTIDQVISLYQKCPQIRQEPHFVDFIFDNTHIYIELIGWILQPNKMSEKYSKIQKQHKQEIQQKDLTTKNPKSPTLNSSPSNRKQESQNRTQSKLDTSARKKRYPYHCMKIVKDNPYFYQMIYLKAYKQELSLKMWFQFLGQKTSEPIDTSLGYLSQIMTPFVRYQFSDSYKIYQELSKINLQKYSKTQGKIFDKNQSNSFLFNSCQTSRPQTQFQKQKKKEHSHQSIVLQDGAIKNEKYFDDSFSTLRIFSPELISFIIKFIKYQEIFKFVHNLVLASLQEIDLKRSKRILQALFIKATTYQIQSQEALQVNTNAMIQEHGLLADTCSEYVRDLLKEICSNVNTEKNYRVIFFVDTILKVQLVQKYIQRIKSSFLVTKQLQDKSMTNSVDFLATQQEQEKLQYYLQSLTFILKIYLKMNKHQNKSQQDLQRQSKYYMEQQNQNVQLSSPDINESRQLKVLKEFSTQINLIFINLPLISNLVKKNQTRTIPYSSGQNIKPITICKYQFFQMVLNCLHLAREFPANFIVDTEKLDLFSIIQRYLNQNRWNNIVHKTLQKIAYMLIVNNNNFFRTNKNNMADAFLDSVIENFTNKNYIFLNSLRFTTQGNIHTLYIIAKAIIYELKKSHKLGNFIHEFQYYKKFVMNDLQSYQTKIFEIENKPNQQDLRKSNRKDDQQPIKLEVDQLSIKQIVKRIEVINKWPVKQNRRKCGSQIQRSLSFVNDDINQNSSISKFSSNSSMKKKHFEENQRGYEDLDAKDEFRHFQSTHQLEIESARKIGDKMTKSSGPKQSLTSYIQEAQASNTQNPPVFIHVTSFISNQNQVELKKLQQKQKQKQVDKNLLYADIQAQKELKNEKDQKPIQNEGSEEIKQQQDFEQELSKYSLRQQSEKQNQIKNDSTLSGQLLGLIQKPCLDISKGNNIVATVDKKQEQSCLRQKQKEIPIQINKNNSQISKEQIQKKCQKVEEVPDIISTELQSINNKSQNNLKIDEKLQK